MAKKQISKSNMIMDAIIIGIVIVMLIVVASTIKQKTDTKDGSKKTTESTSDTTTEKVENGVIKYQCVIDSNAKNTTIFGISFKEADNTFEEYIKAGKQYSELSKGTYKIVDDSFVTTSKKDKKEVTYIKDGDYIFPDNQMYNGEIPEGKKFDATVTYEVKGECKNVLKFKKDGTYEETVVSYAKDKDSKDSTKTVKGTYERKENLIERDSEDGEKMLAFYIYKNQINNAYYKLVK